MKDLTNIIEAILFACGRSISKDEIKNTLDVDMRDIEEAITELEKRYENSNGIELVKVTNEYQLVSNKNYYEYVTKFIENSKKESLSPTCLEVLSIIAYNPNITKSEIENIRGVNSDSQVSRLLEYGLVEEVGRMNLPGRPAMFCITKEFLKSMGINGVEELPDYDIIKSSEEEIDAFKQLNLDDMETKAEEVE